MSLSIRVDESPLSATRPAAPSEPTLLPVEGRRARCGLIADYLLHSGAVSREVEALCRTSDEDLVGELRPSTLNPHDLRLWLEVPHLANARQRRDQAVRARDETAQPGQAPATRPDWSLESWDSSPTWVDRATQTRVEGQVWQVGVEVACSDEQFLDSAHRLLRAAEGLDAAVLVADCQPDEADVEWLETQGICVLGLGERFNAWLQEQPLRPKARLRVI